MKLVKFVLMNPTFLQTPIDYLKGVGPNRADLLRAELGIHTYQDLMNLFPNRYIESLLKQLDKVNGFPIVINTSFNLKDQTMVLTPEDAIKTFLNCEMDILVLGNYVLKKTIL